MHVGDDARYGRGAAATCSRTSPAAPRWRFDNARLYAERARVAQTLRRSLMPAALPAVPGLELASFFRPMGAGSEVGGDFYDVFGDGDGCWLVVGDVCGKGAEAAALTGFLRHTTVAYAREADQPRRGCSNAGQPRDARAGLRRALRDRDPRSACVSRAKASR